MVIWLIGLSGAGKTVIGKEVCGLLKAKRSNVVFLDGDIIREIMGSDVGHTIEDRRTNAGRVCRLCRYLDSQGIDVVCAILSIFSESQRWNRENIPQYFEVYLRVPFRMLLERDSKGLYRQALAGDITDVVGVDIDFPEPAHPDLIIDNDTPVESFAEIANRIVSSILWEDD
ncbi:adenylyl-sulfate kinase [Chloroflexota bacterium]